MPEARPASGTERVQRALDAMGLPLTVVEMPATTRTSQEAATAIGCEVAQIAKSIVFRGSVTGKPVLVIASGVNRIDETAMQSRAGEPLGKANAEFVRAATGYVIGGVPPVGFPAPIETWIDEDLLNYTEVWAAAGSPFAVFRLEPKILPQMTGGQVVKVK
jgi:prolyl-tRNA editing enzyme YbaK/EbsC (Cys-tRNA(Pro) deacylase)